MDVLEAFKNRIYDLKYDAYQKDILLPFYNLEQQDIIKRCFKKNEDINVYFYGGYLNSEYKRVIISLNQPNNKDFMISTMQINTFEDVTLGHREILGSILALGLKREVIGDIINYNNQSYFFTTSKMAPFIKENLVKIGNKNVKIEEYFADVTYEVKYAEQTVFIASMRLDNILANAYNLGRKKAQDLILDGLVKINHEVIVNPSKIVKVNSLLSTRGKGRILIGDILGKTKSGNLILTIKKPV